MSDEPADLRRRVEEREWYHTMDLGRGVVTPGWFDTRSVAPTLPFPDLAGLRCLDVGTFDGFWAFEMERRGAAEVLAVDVPDPEEWDWPPAAPADVRAEVAARHQGGGGFDIAREALGSAVVKHRRSIYDLDPDELGTFDLVYVGSLLLHLRDPVGALDRVRAVCRGHLLLVDAIDWWLSTRYPRRPMAALDGRLRPWWWKPNRAALVRMVEAAGFTPVATPTKLWIPPGPAQQRVPLKPSSVRSTDAREALLRTRVGDPHLAVLARPKAP